MAAKRFTRAITRAIPDSFADSIKFHQPDIPISVSRARMQHSVLVQELRDLINNVIELPAAHSLPDSCFVEDMAVIGPNNSALLTHPGAPVRRAEIEGVRNALYELRVETISITQLEPKALLDGGDVIFTGDEFFVGVSNRTNSFAVAAMASVFNQIPVHAIPVNEALHLKSVITYVNEAVGFIVADNPAGRQSFCHIAAARLSRGFPPPPCTLVPDANAANVLFVDSTLFFASNSSERTHSIMNKFVRPQPTEKSKEQSEELFPNTTEWDLPSGKKVVCSSGMHAEETGVTTVVGLDCSEVNKADGAITCCSILIP